MNRLKSPLFVLTILSALALAPRLHCQDTTKIKTADFAWMTGRWIGHLPTATAEQICSQPQGGEMLCLFRVFPNVPHGKPVMYELYTLADTPTGPELRSLQFPTDLTEKTVHQPLVMTLQKYSDKQVIFAGSPDSELLTSTLDRDTPTTMNGTILFRDSKAPHIQVHWEKVDYNAPWPAK